MTNLKIAILEDEQHYIDMLHSMLLNWKQEHPITLTINHYTNGHDLLVNASYFHLIFIDIKLSNQTDGIDIAKSLRKQGYCGDLIFTTSYRDYSLEGYEVQALHYLIKPVPKEKLWRCMDIVMNKLRPSYHSIFYRNELLKIEHVSISYLASSNHYIDIYKLNGTQPISYRGTFQEEIPKFPSYFKQCHRSILVNMNHVASIKGKELFLTDGTQLPISPSYLEVIRNTILHILND